MSRKVIWITTICSAVAGLAAVAAQPYRLVQISGVSMEPTYHSGELLVARTDVGQLRDGDVVLVDTESGPIIKRVAKVAGDCFDEMRLPFGNWKPVRLPTTGHPRAKFHLRKTPVPVGYIYVLGDNLDHSLDSREFGLVPLSHVRAKLVNQRPHETTFAWLPLVPSAA